MWCLNSLRRFDSPALHHVTSIWSPIWKLSKFSTKESRLNSDQELAMLVKAIQGLPARCRQIFALRKVYGYSQKEIALRLNISENTVEQHLTKAARHCAHTLFDQPVTERRSVLFDRFRFRFRRRKRPNVQGD